MSELSESCVCPCNGRTYVAITTHRKSKSHLYWELQNEMKELKASLTEKDNAILRLQLANERLQELNFFLMEKVKNPSSDE